MAVKHMTDHSAAFHLPVAGIRAVIGGRGAVTAALGPDDDEPPKGGPSNLGDLDEVDIPTIPGEFGRPKPQKSQSRKYKA